MQYLFFILVGIIGLVKCYLSGIHPIELIKKFVKRKFLCEFIIDRLKKIILTDNLFERCVPQ